MQKKISIYVEQSAPGMQIAESVFNNYGAIIVAENSILDEEIITKMRNFGISKVLVYATVETIEERQKRVKIEYNTNVDTMKTVIKEIGSGNSLDLGIVNSIVEATIQNPKENIDIMSCINTVRAAHEYTYTHCVNVSLLCLMIGKWLELPNQSIKDLVLCGLLHDIGKAKINLELLDKPDKLTDAEFEVMKKHVLFGYRLLEAMTEINKKVATAVLMHHERDDGSGYLIGAKSEQIPLYAKILAIADVFDAMTSDRVYRKKKSPFEVFEYIERGTFGKFDPTISLVFLNHMSNYFIGERCRLSDDRVAEIIKINQNNISQPLVKVGEEYLDLCNNSDIKIIEMI